MRKKWLKKLINALMAAVILCSLSGCGIQGNGESESTAPIENPGEAENTAPDENSDETAPIEDDWYMKGNVYSDDKGNRLEVFFDDEGMIEFAVNGLSLYYTTTDSFQAKDNGRVYACDDGTTIILYPGEPARLEISDGEHAGIYECDSDITH